MGVPSLPRQARMSLRRARWASKMRKFDRITSNPHVLSGQPCIRDMRLTVRRVVEAVARYPDRSELLAEYPELEDEDIRQALEFAASALEDQVIHRGAA